MSDDVLKKNYDYYVQNHKSLCKKYLNKYILIKDAMVIKAYDSFEEAIEDVKDKCEYELGTFIIQKCTKTLNETRKIFHSRVKI